MTENTIQSDDLWARALFEQNHRWLMAFLRSMLGDLHAAQDVEQEVFLVAIRQRDKYDGQTAVGAWLRGIAKNLAKEYWRKKNALPVLMDPEHVSQLEQAAETAEEQHDPDEVERRLHAMRACMEALTEKARALLAMKYDEKLRSRAIGEKLGMQETAVDMGLSRARKAVFDCVQLRMAEAAHE